MQIVFIVLNRVEKLDELLHHLHEAGVPDATFLDSRGMAKELAEHNEFRFLGSLRSLFASERKESKVIFTIVKDEMIPVVSRVANEVMGGLQNPNTGILFAMPLSYTEGLPD